MLCYPGPHHDMRAVQAVAQRSDHLRSLLCSSRELWHVQDICFTMLPLSCAVCHAVRAVQAVAQRSDHLAVIAAFNAWSAARAAGGRGAGADFARQHFLSDQVGGAALRECRASR
jgi:hypothetical protein